MTSQVQHCAALKHISIKCKRIMTYTHPVRYIIYLAVVKCAMPKVQTANEMSMAPQSFDVLHEAVIILKKRQ